MTCEKDPKTGRYERCECTDPICACHADPKYRHQWVNAPGRGARTFNQLKFRLEIARGQHPTVHTSKEPTP
jgi:hypothetical protein